MKSRSLLACAFTMLASIAFSRLDAADPGSPPPVIDRSWEVIDGDSETLTFLDRAGSRHRGQIVRARLYSFHDAPNPEGLSGVLTVIEIDCATGAATLVERRRYKRYDVPLDGGIVPPEQRLTRVPVPGSREARFTARLCGHSAEAVTDETVVIRFRISYPICVGLCPDFETRISPSGSAVSHNLHRRDVHRIRVTPRQLGSFRAILDTLRPIGERRLDAQCQPATIADGSPDPLDHPRPDDLEVRWIGPRTSARLTACGRTHPAMRQTIENAMRVLGVDPYTGAPYSAVD